MTAERVADERGDLWPVTGRRCAICRWPLDHVLAETGQDTHPGCYEDDARPEPAYSTERSGMTDHPPTPNERHRP